MNEIKIKYCGLKTVEDVDTAVKAKVDAVGFVFVESSLRFVDSLTARSLVDLARKHKVSTVALFADNQADNVRQIINTVQPDILQFHGAESAEFCEQFGLPYWKAIPMLSTMNYQQYMEHHPHAEAYLLDAFGKTQSGGSGQSFTWFEFPAELRHKLILAGGINARNIADALLSTKAQFIDTSSGIESSSGVKSKLKMMELAKIINNQ